MSTEIVFEIAVVALCLAAGGILKGATGAGAPLLAVPALAAFFDVRFAIVVMLVPNIVTNSWQALRFRAHMPEMRLVVPLAGGGVAGVALGTFALKQLPAEILSVVMAGAVCCYVALRLARPGWHMRMATGHVFALPAGIAAGVLQGAAGLSAPVSITFLNALQMGREAFIAGISLLFTAFTVVQIAVIWRSGLLMPGELYYSAFAVVPIALAMPLGGLLARRMSPSALDRLILAVLVALAARLIFESLS